MNMNTNGNSRLNILLFAMLCLTGAATARDIEDHYAILPVSQGPRLMKPCSRPGPKAVTGFWEPTPAQVQSIEKRLPAFLAKGGHKAKLSDSCRQYIGIISHGKKLIYLNAFPTIFGSRPTMNWKTTAVIVCDGGDSVWGVEFDPADNSFYAFEANGFA